jgi:hypothetical protein
MTERKNRQDRHEFGQLPEFDKALRRIVGTPKSEVDRREAAARKQRKGRK